MEEVDLRALCFTNITNHLNIVRFEMGLWLTLVSTIMFLAILIVSWRSGRPAKMARAGSDESF